jgi:hypothetical protein
MRIINNGCSRSQNCGVHEQVCKSLVVVKDGVVQPDMERQFTRALIQAYESAERTATFYGRDVAVVELMPQPRTNWASMAMAA